MRSPKSTVQPTIEFFATVNQIRRLPPASDYCRALFCFLNCTQQFDYHALSSSRKPEGAVEHLFPEFSKFTYVWLERVFGNRYGHVRPPLYQLQEATRETVKLVACEKFHLFLSIFSCHSEKEDKPKKKP